MCGPTSLALINPTHRVSHHSIALCFVVADHRDSRRKDMLTNFLAARPKPEEVSSKLISRMRTTALPSAAAARVCLCSFEIVISGTDEEVKAKNADVRKMGVVWFVSWPFL